MTAENPSNRAITGQRLDRIEQKIDRLAETVISLARAEEKLTSLEEDKKFLMERMLKVEDRVSSNERRIDDNSNTLSVISRVFWITLTCLITAAVGTYVAVEVQHASKPAIYAPARP